MGWKVHHFKKPTLRDPILIEGLPGIGNVGKVAVDFLVEEMGAKKLCEFTSYGLPHSVFVNDQNLIELPTIELYYKQTGGKHDILLLAGDVQPIDENSCYEFTDQILDILQDIGVSQIVTLGGIGLQSIPKEPKVYCTGNEKKIINYFKKGTKLNDQLYGVVGPIIGVSGLLLGLAQRRSIPAISLLAETYGHPMYLGVKGARHILSILQNKLELSIKIERLDEEIEELEKELLKRSQEFSEITKKRVKKKQKIPGEDEVRYIG